VVLRIKRAKRVCKNCPKQGVITQPAPPFSQERSKYGDGLIALVLVDKFADHLPLRRQIKRFKRDGVHIPISNLCRMVQKSADLLKHVVKIMYQELLAGDFIQGDETGIPILHGRKNVPKKGVLWVYTNGDHAVFSVTRDKNGVRPETFLQGRYYSKPVDRFKGVFLPDGASVFNTACAIEDVINDFKKDIPSDRLIVGDVAFGKTEVIIRALFLAVRSGLQCIVLVPTTLLAKQHYDNFTKRFKPFNISIMQISRFVTNKDKLEIYKNISDGSANIIVGTHALLNDKINFKKLGLIVYDKVVDFLFELSIFIVPI
jgi:hypothetical protein